MPIAIAADFEQRIADYRWRAEHIQHPEGLENYEDFLERTNFMFDPPMEVRLDNLARLKPPAYKRELKATAKETGLAPGDLDDAVKAIHVRRVNVGSRQSEQAGVCRSGGDDSSAPSDETVDLRPTIMLNVGETERVVDELEDLFIRGHRGLYERGGLIVSTALDKMKTWNGKTVISQVIEERGDYALMEDAEAVAKFEWRDGAGKSKRRPAPMSIVRTLKERKHRLRLQTLVALANCPSISVDGALLNVPGFDPTTGVLFDPLGVSFPRVPEMPSKRLAETAFARISQLLKTFDFESEDDRAVGLSLLFTAIARRGLPFAPLHGFDAPVAGCGKSTLVDIASTLATGHEAGVIAQGETREEMEKRLSGMLMRGDPLIAIDNCELPLEGVVLNQALTQHTLDLRILGSSKMIRTQAKPLICATGNNLIIKGDAVRRSLIGRLDPKCERPELRTFDYDPLADAKENRGDFVAAILTILLAYHVAGRPHRPKPPLQSFVPWSDTVRGAILWVGGGDPVKTMGRMREADPVLTNLRTVLTAWYNVFGDAPRTLSDVILTATRAHAPAALRDALLFVGGRGDDIRVPALGQWLGRQVGRVVDIGDGAPNPVSFQKAGKLHGSQQWRVRSVVQSADEGGEGG